MEYKLTDVIITSVRPGGSGDAIPIEEVSFTYQHIQIQYTTRDGEVVQAQIENI